MSDDHADDDAQWAAVPAIASAALSGDWDGESADPESGSELPDADERHYLGPVRFWIVAVGWGLVLLAVFGTSAARVMLAAQHSNLSGYRQAANLTWWAATAVVVAAVINVGLFSIVIRNGRASTAAGARPTMLLVALTLTIAVLAVIAVVARYRGITGDRFSALAGNIVAPLWVDVTDLVSWSWLCAAGGVGLVAAVTMTLAGADGLGFASSTPPTNRQRVICLVTVVLVVLVGSVWAVSVSAHRVGVFGRDPVSLQGSSSQSITYSVSAGARANGSGTQPALLSGNPLSVTVGSAQSDDEAPGLLRTVDRNHGTWTFESSRLSVNGGALVGSPGGELVIANTASTVAPLLGFDARTGRIRWASDIAGSADDIANLSARVLLLVDRASAGDESDLYEHLYALDPTSGKLLWQKSVQGTCRGAVPDLAAVGDEVVIIDGCREHPIQRLDAVTGDVLRQLSFAVPVGELRDGGYGDSAVRLIDVASDGKLLIYASFGNSMRVLDTETDAEVGAGFDLLPKRCADSLVRWCSNG